MISWEPEGEHTDVVGKQRQPSWTVCRQHRQHRQHTQPLWRFLSDGQVPWITYCLHVMSPSFLHLCLISFNCRTPWHNCNPARAVLGVLYGAAELKGDNVVHTHPKNAVFPLHPSSEDNGSRPTGMPVGMCQVDRVKSEPWVWWALTWHPQST